MKLKGRRDPREKVDIVIRGKKDGKMKHYKSLTLVDTTPKEVHEAVKRMVKGHRSEDELHREILDDIKRKFREQGMSEAVLKAIEKFYPTEEPTDNV